MPEGAALYPLAFGAGALSFLSPCVLPLVPGYVSYMSGLGGTETEARSPRRAGLMALLFVAGFTTVFVPLGVTASLLGSFLDQNRVLFTRIGGAFIILMGLVFLGVIKIPLLYREARFHPTPNAGSLGSFVLGLAFAFGWSPCIGPILGASLTLAAGQDPSRGALLLLFYSLGLGVPFVLAGLGIARLTGVVAALRRHTRVLMTTSGVLLIVMGLLFMTDSLFRMSIWIQRGFDRLGLDFLARI
ncbi:MAG TPA: cytochrome c biogenesis protein CcdA [Actinomycetota bacterium]|nr:cytochrome c biogenesis protein CcdA [Actinomycetota bacterium]